MNQQESSLNERIGNIILESQLHFKQPAYANSTFLATNRIEKLILQEKIDLLNKMWKHHPEDIYGEINYETEKLQNQLKQL